MEHEVHADGRLLASEYLPASQVKHALEPVLGWKVPPAQGVQPDAAPAE